MADFCYYYYKHSPLLWIVCQAGEVFVWTWKTYGTDFDGLHLLVTVSLSYRAVYENIWHQCRVRDFNELICLKQHGLERYRNKDFFCLIRLTARIWKTTMPSLSELTENFCRSDRGTLYFITMDLGSATMNSLQVTARIRDTNWKKNTRNQNTRNQSPLWRSRVWNRECAHILLWSD